MKHKIIFKIAAAMAATAGIAFGAYKFGEFVGRDDEKEKAEEEMLDAINKNEILAKEITILREELRLEQEINRNEIDKAKERITALTRAQRTTSGEIANAER